MEGVTNASHALNDDKKFRERQSIMGTFGEPGALMGRGGGRENLGMPSN